MKNAAPMTSTERKLDEARYFLSLLNIQDPYFDYILSAYLNAARSTAWVMRYEFCRKPGWEEWFKSCEILENDRTLMKRINELRVECAKKSGIKTDYLFLDHVVVDEDYYAVVKEILELPDGTRVKLTISDEERECRSDPDRGVFEFKGTVRFSGEDSAQSREAIFKLCVDYFNFLQTRVVECHTRFGPNRT